MFTTAAQLLDLTDSEPAHEKITETAKICMADRGGCRSKSTEKLIMVLRDGRKLIGVLRSWDQFGTD